MTASDEAAVRAHLAECQTCRDEHDYLAVVPEWLDLVKQQPANDAAGQGTELNSADRPVAPK
jgi:predicted anti-sigma-YlaC factor YlaD